MKMKVTKMIEKTTILVVDDEEVIRHSYVRALAGEHCSVATVWNGEEALHMMELHPFDVVLLDQRMPEMDGMTVLKVIKEKWPESEVIMITGYPGVESAKQAVALGAYDYLAKPVGPDEVINAAQGAVLHKKWAMRGDQETARAGAR
jgi:DNA-binding NtrC family response regulator